MISKEIIERYAEAELARVQRNATVEVVEDFDDDDVIKDQGDNSFQVGDIITVPTEYKIFKSTNTKNGLTSKYILVSIRSKSGVERVGRWYPSAVVKNIFEYEKTLREGADELAFVARHKTTGSLVDLFKANPALRDAVKALVAKGGSFKIADAKTISSRDFDDKAKSTNVTLYKYDVVAPAAPEQTEEPAKGSNKK